MKEVKNVIFIDIDGLSYDFFYEALFSGKLPHFYSVFCDGLYVEKTFSVFPTTTLPAQTSIFTGCFPRKHKIVGNSTFDRKRKIYRNYTNMHTALSVFGYKLLGPPDILLPPTSEPPLLHYDVATKTIYEILTENNLISATIFSHLSKGATYFIRPKKSDLIQYAFCHENLSEQFVFDKIIFKRAGEFLEGISKLPNLTTIYLSGLDGYSHWFGPSSQRWYLSNVLDKEFGEFLKVLSKKTDLENIYFVLSSDHGQTATIKDKRHLLNSHKIAKYLSEWKFYSKRKKLDFCDIVTGEDGGLLIHLKNTNTKRWEDAPLKDDISSVIEKLLLSQKVLGNWIDIILIKGETEYKVFQDEKEISLQDYFKNKDKYPESISRLGGYFCERSADIIALSNYDEGFYFGDKTYSGEHGNLTQFESIVPLIISGPGIKFQRKDTASIIDITPTILKLLGIETYTMEGKPLL